MIKCQNVIVTDPNIKYRILRRLNFILYDEAMPLHFHL